MCGVLHIKYRLANVDIYTLTKVTKCMATKCTHVTNVNVHNPNTDSEFM